jgi:hypothetical protein
MLVKKEAPVLEGEIVGAEAPTQPLSVFSLAAPFQNRYALAPLLAELFPPPRIIDEQVSCKCDNS